jgi:hypothetical protein
MWRWTLDGISESTAFDLALKNEKHRKLEQRTEHRFEATLHPVMVSLKRPPASQRKISRATLENDNTKGSVISNPSTGRSG